ncbi:MAG: hypothetical protein IKF78_01265 [Atopobiaceae bacterium]|nr:hypothetical protein [Atopobiaceae bacterium]
MKEEHDALSRVYASALQTAQDLVSFMNDYRITEEAARKLEDAANHISKAEALIVEAGRLQQDAASEDGK